jgi:hypothetical protein
VLLHVEHRLPSSELGSSYDLLASFQFWVALGVEIVRSDVSGDSRGPFNRPYGSAHPLVDQK